jgi:hypothetical protein
MARQHGSRPEHASVHDPVLVAVLLALATGMATASVLGPVMTGVMEYRTSPTTLNQLLGSDAAALFVIAPLTTLAAVLVAHGRAAGTALATGTGVYALYTYAQVAIGQEYLRLPGNVEHFFPLLLTIFILGGAAVLLGWARMPVPMPPNRTGSRVGAAALGDVLGHGIAPAVDAGRLGRASVAD